MANTKIQETTDYNIFKGIVGNRSVNRYHVAQLTKAVARKNLLAQNPIIVNSKMQVIDGQHRLEVAKANKLPVYYIIAGDTNLEDVQQLNAFVRPWRGMDYLESYGSVGKPNYIKLKEFMETYGINLAMALELLSGGRQRTWTAFKRGEFVISNEEMAHGVAQMLIALKPYASEKRVTADKDFVRALLAIANDVSAEQLMAKLEVSGKLIEPQIDKKAYIRQFEDIINWKSRREYTRLY